MMVWVLIGLFVVLTTASLRKSRENLTFPLRLPVALFAHRNPDNGAA